jgi:hypothetical protein
VFLFSNQSKSGLQISACFGSAHLALPSGFKIYGFAYGISVKEAPPFMAKKPSDKEIYQAQLVLACAKKDKKASKSTKAVKENINPSSATKADSKPKRKPTAIS